MIVDLRGAAEHAGVEEERECGCLQRRLGQHAPAIGLPQHLQEQRCNYGVDVDAVDLENRVAHPVQWLHRRRKSVPSECALGSEGVPIPNFGPGSDGILSPQSR